MANVIVRRKLIDVLNVEDIGTLIIKEMLDLADRETVALIQENPCSH